ncbi:MAG: PIG-L family deacetylase [Candidatus Methanofastidiosia archaeon]|jgi:hypothetical protein
MRTFILISPHQDDEWLAYAKLMYMMRLDNLRRDNWNINVIYVTKSLWPSFTSYQDRIDEAASACAYIGAKVHYLGLTEEELFDPPYHPDDYIGDTKETNWSPVLLSKLQEIVQNVPCWLAYPSDNDAAEHVVHGFTRNITTAIKDDESLDISREFEYTLYVTSHPADHIYYDCNQSWKLGAFQTFYPSQWAVIEPDPIAKEMVEWACKYEYEDRG